MNHAADRSIAQPIPKISILIGGQWRKGAETRPVVDPCRRDTVAAAARNARTGGIKASGIGREGPRYAIRDMTEERLVVFNT